MTACIPLIETPRLVLRHIRPHEVSRACEIYQDPEVMRYVGDGKPRSRETVEQLIAAREHFWCTHGFGVWTLFSKEMSDVVGHCFLGTMACSSDIEMGYLLGRQAWGKGLATEAARAALEYGFHHVGLPRIVATVHPDNVASVRILEKLGMRDLKSRQCREHQLYGLSRTQWERLGVEKDPGDFRNVHLCPLTAHTVRSRLPAPQAVCY